MEPKSKFIGDLEAAVLQKMKNKKIPWLNIIASCPTPDCFAGFPFGKEGTKHLMGGGKDKASDNLIGMEEQSSPVKYLQLQEEHVGADHGLFDVPEYPRVFSHPEAVKKIVDFCTNHFTTVKRDEVAFSIIVNNYDGACSSVDKKR